MSGSRPNVRRCVGFALLGGLLALVPVSCGGNGPKLHPVRGKVLAGDAPADGAVVVLQPMNSAAESLKPSGVVGPDGSFTLRTHPHGDGAPEGEYVALVTWYPPDARESGNAQNKLPAKYADVSQSPLKATVRSGDNQLEPFIVEAPRGPAGRGKK